MAKKKSIPRGNADRFRDVTFVELPCEEYRVLEAKYGGDHEPVPSQRPVIIMGPAARVRQVMKALKKGWPS